MLLLLMSFASCALYAAMFVMVTESVCLGSGSALRIHVQVAVVADVMVSSPWPYSAWRKADVEGCGVTHLVSVERGGRGRARAEWGREVAQCGRNATRRRATCNAFVVTHRGPRGCRRRQW